MNGTSPTQPKTADQVPPGYTSTGNDSVTLTPTFKPASNTSTISTSRRSADHTPTKVSSISGGEIPRTTSTMTITNHLSSTYSSAPAMSVTNLALSTPAAVTALNTPTEPNGDFVTYTYAIANPVNTSSKTSEVGLFNNNAATAGVFAVVGMIFTAMAVFLGLLFRRYRRSVRDKRRHEAIQPQPLSVNPFEGPHYPPEIRSTGDKYGIVWDATHMVSPATGQRLSARNSDHRSTSCHTGASKIPLRTIAGPEDGPTNSHGHLSHPIDQNQDQRISAAESSPSIYPASPPAIGDDNQFQLGPPLARKSSPDPIDYSVVAPPRPPRSHLRPNIANLPETYPMTAPASTSSQYSDLLLPSPISQETRYSYKGLVLQRRPILDVRPRHSTT